MQAKAQTTTQLRRRCSQVQAEIGRLIERITADKPMVKGSVYEMRRKCGKESCRCARGELHASKVLSWSEEGRTRLRAIPKGTVGELRTLTQRYQRFRRARARIVKLQQELITLIDQLEKQRRTEAP